MKTITKITNDKNLTMTAGIHRKNKGLVIIAVLWMVVVLMVMTAILGRKSRLDMKVCLTRMEAVRCKWACRAGIEKAIAVLNEDETENDSLLDLWSDNAEDFNDIMLDKCWFTVRVIDESSKLNINAATKEQLLGLPDMVEEIADAIIDWRDSDDMPSGMGVESGYYEGLTYGYIARNGPFKTLRELLLVKDVTEELFYGEDTNLNGRLDYNERDGQESPPADDGDNVLDVGWAEYLTCYPSGSNASSAGETSGEQTQSSGTQQQSSGTQQQSSGGQQQSSGTQQQSSGGQQQTSENQGRTSGNQGQTSGNQGQTSGNAGQTSGNTQQTSGNTQQTSGNTGQTSGGTGQTSESTSQTSAKVNINTASDIVLAALLGGGDEAERTAQAIISYRNTLAEGIEDISELTEQGILSNDVFGQLEDYITTSSDIFTIRCFATADRNGVSGTTLHTEAVVDRSSTPCRILFWYQETNN
ncbi:MAG TPA: type II secretion system protein GspK [Sedimentisphaerales bacterium]|nr:type II secretion system protein GspK [Sedimentisphaerales bacterium]